MLQEASVFGTVGYSSLSLMYICKAGAYASVAPYGAPSLACKY
jgi:hypothetical protein